jgi:hypothetical protein
MSGCEKLKLIPAIATGRRKGRFKNMLPKDYQQQNPDCLKDCGGCGGGGDLSCIRDIIDEHQ